MIIIWCTSQCQIHNWQFNQQRISLNDILCKFENGQLWIIKIYIILDYIYKVSDGYKRSQRER